MIRAEHCVNGMKSLDPPMLQSGPIKIRVQHVPACCYQIIDSLFDNIGASFYQEDSAGGPS